MIKRGRSPMLDQMYGNIPLPQICRYCGERVMWADGVRVYVHVLPSGDCQNPKPGIQVRVPDSRARRALRLRRDINITTNAR